MYDLYTLYSKCVYMCSCFKLLRYFLSRLNCQKQTCLLASNKMQCQEECLKYDSRGNSMIGACCQFRKTRNTLLA